MRVLIDTCVLVDFERGNEDIIEFLEELDKHNVEMLISAINVSELYTGVYLSENTEKNIARMNEIIAHFGVINMNENVAKETGKLLAYRQIQGMPKYYEDSAISASAIAAEADFLITENVKDFDFPGLEGKVFTAKEFLKKMRKGIEWGRFAKTKIYKVGERYGKGK